MRHHAVVLGDIGSKKIYIDVTVEVAVDRFLKRDDGIEYRSGFRPQIDEFDFDDEFGVYDAWPL